MNIAGMDGMRPRHRGGPGWYPGFPPDRALSSEARATFADRIDSLQHPQLPRARINLRPYSQEADLSRRFSTLDAVPRELLEVCPAKGQSTRCGEGNSRHSGDQTHNWPLGSPRLAGAASLPPTSLPACRGRHSWHSRCGSRWLDRADRHRTGSSI